MLGVPLSIRDHSGRLPEYSSIFQSVYDHYVAWRCVKLTVPVVLQSRLSISWYDIRWVVGAVLPLLGVFLSMPPGLIDGANMLMGNTGDCVLVQSLATFS